MADWFEEKLASQITPADLQRLVEEEASEDQRLDFKQQPYEPVKRHEMLKDVTALANTDGGYLLIGVRELGDKACGFLPVANARRVAEGIHKSCVQNITPRIDGLEVVPVTVLDGGEVIVVRVPVSARGPHMFTLGGRTQFMRRYGTENRAMTMADIREAFMDDSILRELGRLREDIGESAAARRPVVLGEVTAEDDPLATSDPEELSRLMSLRFQMMAEGEPFFRVTAVPLTLKREALDVSAQAIQNVLRDPPQTRQRGWTIRKMPDAKMTPEGLSGSRGDQRITVLANGYVEFTRPARSDDFQWRQSAEEVGKHPYLYPYTVCEFTVSFVRFVAALYGAAELAIPVAFGLEFASIRGFRILPGLPGRGGLNWAVAVEDGYGRPYEGAMARARTEPRGFPADPDPIAYELLTKIYQQFGNKAEDVPLFDADRHFVVPDE